MRYQILTLGCPKNDVDAEMMGQLLREAGHVPEASVRRADLLIVNTCAFVHDARDESYGVLRELAAAKRRGQYLVAAGCLAQRYAGEIYRQVPGVDAVLGTQSWPQVADLLRALQSDRRSRPTIAGVSDLLVTSVARRPTASTAYLKIADGCSATCAFCAIPLIKGPQRSKPQDHILREVRELVDQGVREIVLIAQNSTAYGRDLGLGDALPGLLEEICAAAPTLDWLRILYAYPQDISPRLIETMARLPQVCHYVDLPLQHAHPDVLASMGRPFSRDPREVVDRVREFFPEAALRTTFIVGYPGETEERFAALESFVRDARFMHLGVFPYYPEDGSEAAVLPDQLPDEVKEERRDRIMALQAGISEELLTGFEGQEFEVLVDRPHEEWPGLYEGRTWFQAPEVDGITYVSGENVRPGTMVRAVVEEAKTYDLVALA